MKKISLSRWMPALGSTPALLFVMLVSQAGCDARHVVGGIGAAGGHGGAASTGTGTGGASVVGTGGASAVGVGGAGGNAGAAGKGPGGSGAAGGAGAGGSSPLSCAGPVLWGPRRGAYTGSPTADGSLMTLRPTFKWHAPSGCAADTYEIQIDNSCGPGQIATCAFPSPEVTATVPASTTLFTPSAALAVRTTAPVGAIYAWRVRACAGACGAWSEVGYLNVGRVANDINGDGYADLIASSVDQTSSIQALEIYPGSPTPGTTAPVHLGELFGGGVSYVGDVNGDGFGDFMSSTAGTTPDTETPVFFFGGPNLSALTSVAFSSNQNATTGASAYFRPAGDFNGDGFSDVALTARAATTDIQLTFNIFFGAAAFADKAPDLTTWGPSSAPYQAFDTPANVGDLNGDAFSDVAIFHGAPGTMQTLVRIFLGGSSPDVSGDTDVPIAGDLEPLVDPSGDVNGDGYDDLILSDHGVLPGGSTVPSSYVPFTGFGGVLLSGFDINADGNADMLLRIQPGQIILGGPTPMTTVGLNALAETLRTRQSTWADYNGDGRIDFALGESWLNQVLLVLNDGTLDPAATAPLPGPAVSPYALTGAIATGH